ncbi:LacI family transcriptional regulator [Actinomyces sp. B33]|uniref:LacI family DNA-binding transcriptional regulator n=1 Tax=Actinomyces sp. B33 TaxID=2942131 RepID=UPI002341B105|nr:LacI family DNA-binding transcriptional regulator [Actinomyces sp. B33]MDC4233270.1 LacI family transcriptional regulator [Actinomyces sp. B33]
MARARNRATMKDVARRAGVSVSAVSFAYNNPARLSDETVKVIQEAAEELGYVRDPAARTLRTGTTHNLGLLLPQSIGAVFSNPYYSELVSGIGQTCTREGLFLLLIPPLKGSMAKAVPVSTVDGFLVVGLESDRSEIKAIRRQHTPFIVIDGDPQPGIPTVGLDEERAMGEVVEHLLALGHRRLLLLAFESGHDRGVDAWHGSLRRRYQGVIAAIEARGLIDNVRLEIAEIPLTKSAAHREIVRRWTSRGPHPTAVVCFSDILALGAIGAFTSMGIAIPDQVSVTGFDDIPESEWARPALTTVRQSIRSKGRIAADRLVEAILAQRGESSFEESEHHEVPGVLIVRDSTGRSRRSAAGPEEGGPRP